ncbi:MAG: TlpA family protein disulfide reductase, partial [Lachnospiraceae bacterium]|nr:TlpA family protein disulfide reductase [Lachnospiraceae bacterium]
IAEGYTEDIAEGYTEDIAEGYTEDIAEGYTEASGGAGGDEPANDEPADEEEAYEPLPAPDFTLTDQYGKTHTLSDYKGKTVFLNFWATWCPPCREEMPYIQEIYEETQADGDSDLVILAVAFPNLGKEMDEDGVKDFLEENGYTYPTVFDTEASLLAPYYITAYPTTYMIDRNGNIYGYAPGSMTKEIMEDIIRQTREAE